MPTVYEAAGRVLEIQHQASTLVLTLVRDQKLQQIHFPVSPPHSQYLREGDLVAVISADEILLLAPQRASLPARTFNPDILMQWNQYLNLLRAFFQSAGFLELKTPTLVSCPGTEPSLDVFVTEFKVGSRQHKVFLPTSPELHLKKALALGADKIFELASCFRNGEVTERHQPEFLMLEWYRAYDNLETIKKDVEQLVYSLANAMKQPLPRTVQSFSVAQLFKIYCDFELTPQTTKDALKALALRLGVDVHSAESIDDYFFLIFTEKIETQLPPEDLLFVEKYPPYQAALARLTKDGWGDRFEVYWKGLELANAFHELNNPEIQRMRSAEDLEKKQQLQKELVNLDEEFFQCLDAGLPPSGGIALGVERLFMALTNQKEIRNLRMFPLL